MIGRRYPPQVRQWAVRLTQEQAPAHGSEWATVVSVSRRIGCTPETLRKWVRQAKRHAGTRHGSTTEERARLKQLERENHELKRANRILRKASALTAAAELDLRSG